MSIRSFIINALVIQLLMSIASLPFLLWWHMPYPLLSILGNLIHPIFLTTFLLLASALFCASLIGLPHELLAQLLTMITQIWDRLLDIPVPSGWLALHWWYLIPASTLAFIIGIPLMHTRRSSQIKKIAVVITLLNAGTILWRMHAGNSPHLTILHRGEHTMVCIPHRKGTIEIVDHGYISSARDTKAVVHYDIIPHILFTYGMPSHIEVRGYGHRVTKAAKMLKKLVIATSTAQN